MMSATGQLLAKELRLQKSNAMFTLAVVLLGGLGLISATGAGPEIAGFSTDEIKLALFSTALLPVLVAILPLMIGSTAAASEKAMGVWAWQAALPASWRHVIAVKVVVAAFAISIVAGTLPYLMQLGLRSLNTDMVSFVFRETWPGWIGLLCGAIGFYAGTHARDDYQGLLLAIPALAGIAVVMWLADPSMLVFPVIPFFTEPFWMEWALALRLMLIATGFIYFGSHFLGRTTQRRWLRVAGHAVIMAVGVFCLTLWNVVTERSLLEGPGSPPMTMEHFPVNMKTATYTFPYSRASLRSHYGGNFHARFYDLMKLGTDENWLIAGALQRSYQDSRLRSEHPFTFTRRQQVYEFPQAAHYFDFKGWTENGRWICVADGEGKNHLLCGPWGLAVSSAYMPQSWFQKLRDLFELNEPATKDFPMYVPNALKYPSMSGLTEKDGRPVYMEDGVVSRRYNFDSDDVIVQPGPRRGIIWKNGRTFAAGAHGTTLRAGQFAEGIAVIVPTDAGVTATAVLKPASRQGVYELAGWTSGSYVRISPDYKWVCAGRRSSGNGDYVITRLNPNSHLPNSDTSASLAQTWTVAAERTADDGSTMTLNQFGDMSIMKIGGGEYTYFTYRKVGKVTLGNRLADAQFPYEEGVVLVNLATGKESIIPIPIPWPAAGTMHLQGAIPPSWETSYRFQLLSVDSNKHGRLMVWSRDRGVGVILDGGDGREVTAKKFYVPSTGRNDYGVFFDKDQYLFYDLQNLMVINMVWPRIN